MQADDTRAELAVVAHALLGSVSIVAGALEVSQSSGEPLGEDLLLITERHMERLAQFLSLLARGHVELAATALVGAGS